MVCGSCGSWFLRPLGCSGSLAFAVSWFSCFSLSEFICMCLREGLTDVFNKCPNLPFPSSENSISGHLLKFIVQLFLLDLCFTTNNLWGKRGAQFFI